MPWETYNATFRNIPFEVKSFNDDDIGREMVIKHIARSDNYAIEDLHLMPEKFNIEGAIFGTESQAQWESLKAAFQEQGSGRFQHNYIQEPFDVHIDRSTLTVDDSKEDAIYFSVTMIKAGLDIFENQGASAFQDFSVSATNLRLRANDYLLNNTRLSGVTGFARGGAVTEVQRFNTFLNGVLQNAQFTQGLVSATGNVPYSNAIASFKSLINQVPVLNTSVQIFDSITSTISLLSSVSTNDKVFIQQLEPYVAEQPYRYPETGTENMENYNTNVQVTNNAAKIIVLAEASEKIPELEFESYDEAIEFKDRLISTALKIENLDTQTNIEVIEFIEKLETHIPKEAEDLPNLITVTQTKNSNVVDLLFKQELSSDTVESVLRRNGIKNPFQIELDEVEILESA